MPTSVKLIGGSSSACCFDSLVLVSWLAEVPVSVIALAAYGQTASWTQ